MGSKNQLSLPGIEVKIIKKNTKLKVNERKSKEKLQLLFFFLVLHSFFKEEPIVLVREMKRAFLILSKISKFNLKNVQTFS